MVVTLRDSHVVAGANERRLYSQPNLVPTSCILKGMMTFNYGNLALRHANISEGLKARGKQLQWLVI